MIQLVSKNLVFDDNTFAPFLEIVVRVPLETMQDAKLSDPKLAEKVGEEFLSLLESNKVIGEYK